MENIFEFYKGKRVFLTGHTGFKGSWMCKMLANAGAIVTGYSLEAPTEPSLFKIANIEGDIHSVIGDIRDMAALKAAFDDLRLFCTLQLNLLCVTLIRILSIPTRLTSWVQSIS